MNTAKSEVLPSTVPPTNNSGARSPSMSSSATPSQPVDDLVRIFNTALVSSRVESQKSFSEEVFALMDSPAFRSILHAIRQMSKAEGISEAHAAEKIITTFRKLDRLWDSYLLNEGVSKVRGK